MRTWRRRSCDRNSRRESVRRRFLLFYVLIVSIFFCDISCRNKAKEEAIYAQRIGDLADVILVQSSACLNQTKAYSVVWEYVRVTGEDFDSAAKHILGPARAEAKGQFHMNKMNIDDFMQKVENPTEKYRYAHEKLREIYALYVKLHELALKPAAPREEYEASAYRLYDELLNKSGEMKKLLGE